MTWPSFDNIKPEFIWYVYYVYLNYQAIAKLGWVKPTLIQDKAITLALEGKDVLARARTGSGKTGAYVIPIVQKILRSKQVCYEIGIMEKTKKKVEN